jgi:DNA-binding MarR family transcriptional regulator
LEEIENKSLKGVTLEMRSSFHFFKLETLGQNVILLKSKYPLERYTPKACKKMADMVTNNNGLPCAFWFDALDYNQRMRLMDKQVFFVVSGKYAYLPGLVMDSRNKRKTATELTSPAQYVLLYHLQAKSLESRSAKELAEVTPYKYVTLTLAIQVLQDLGLCTLIADGNQERRLHFELKGRALWEKAFPLLKSPLKKSFYCDSVKNEVTYPQGGINALAHYSMLVPEATKTLIAVERTDTVKDDNYERINSWDGAFRIEIWKYPPLNIEQGFADRLSLALTLMNNEDPRVHKEVERIIDETWLKD